MRAVISVVVPVMVGGILAMELAIVTAHAADTPFPVRPMRIIVPTSTGGGSDLAARLLAQAQNPVIAVDRAARSPNGVALLVQLAEGDFGELQKLIGVLAERLRGKRGEGFLEFGLRLLEHRAAGFQFCGAFAQFVEFGFGPRQSLCGQSGALGDGRGTGLGDEPAEAAGECRRDQGNDNFIHALRMLNPSRERERNVCSGATRRQPCQIARGTAPQVEHDELRRIVGMLGENELFQSGHIGAARFQHHQHLCARLDLAFPPVVRFHPRHQIRAGDEPSLQCKPCKPPSRFQVRRGDENEGKGGGGFHWEVGASAMAQQLSM